MRPSWVRRWRRLHRLLAMVVGLQVFFWVLGGFTMASLDLERVRGEDRNQPAAALALDGVDLIPLQQLLDSAGVQAPLREVRLVQRLGQPLYQLKGQGERWLFNAVTAQQLSPLSAEQAQIIALQDYAEAVEVQHLRWIDQAGTEYRGRELPLWEVRLADSRATSLYVDPYTAEVVARRNNYWRVFDWMWMLHIMDYRERSNFNHPLLLVFAATALAFVISGAVLLISTMLSKGPRQKA